MKTIPITTHSCKRGQCETCALTELVLAKTGSLTREVGVDGKPIMEADSKGVVRPKIVPEMAIKAMLTCQCACHQKAA